MVVTANPSLPTSNNHPLEADPFTTAFAAFLGPAAAPIPAQVVAPAPVFGPGVAPGVAPVTAAALGPAPVFAPLVAPGFAPGPAPGFTPGFAPGVAPVLAAHPPPTNARRARNQARNVLNISLADMVRWGWLLVEDMLMLGGNMGGTLIVYNGHVSAPLQIPIAMRNVIDTTCWQIIAINANHSVEVDILPQMNGVRVLLRDVTGPTEMIQKMVEMDTRLGFAGKLSRAWHILILVRGGQVLGALGEV
ncbi:cyclin-dependent kinase inhibitor 1C (p57, Kip2) [Trapelia coarctata]|nr:cyclin-dependent kinase inhibitor 1C (p57, Kip2) [Trapelia coarctata]